MYLLDLVSCTGHIVDNSIDCVSSNCVDICHEPIMPHVYLNSPCQYEAHIWQHKVRQPGGRFSNSPNSVLEYMNLSPIFRVRRHRAAMHREVQNI